MPIVLLNIGKLIFILHYKGVFISILALKFILPKHRMVLKVYRKFIYIISVGRSKVYVFLLNFYIEFSFFFTSQIVKLKIE